MCRSFSLLPKSETGKYKLAENNYAFAKDAEQVDSPTWYTMETSIPFVHDRDSITESDEWAGPAALRSSSTSPLYSVSHDVTIALTFAYDLPGSDERARERLNFTVPLSFGRYLPSASPATVSQVDNGGAASVPSSRPSSPFSNLPSYSQLYDDNGDRKVDLSIPLPLYTPQEVPAPKSNDAQAASHGVEEKPITPTYHHDAQGVDETEPLLPLLS